MRWYPFDIEAYAHDTRHLTLAEHGAYRLLIDAYMRDGEPPPDNDRALARIVGVGVDEWLEVAANVRPFFRSKDGLLVHKRCENELRAQRWRSQKQSEKGKKGAFAKYSRINRMNGTGIAQAWPHPPTLNKEIKTSTEQAAEVAEEAFEKKGIKSYIGTPELSDLIKTKGWS